MGAHLILSELEALAVRAVLGECKLEPLGRPGCSAFWGRRCWCVGGYPGSGCGLGCV